MKRPEELKSNARLVWSTGRGADVWSLFRAAMAGDTVRIERLLKSDPSLVRCHWAYRTPIYFAVRENRLEAARLLLQRGADPLSLAVNDTLLDIASDRGYGEMRKMLEAAIAARQHASSEGNAVAAAIREANIARMRRLLNRSPGLLHAGDERSNQPIHWAVMTRQIGVIDELLQRGADINAARFDGARPIQLCNGDYHYRGWRDVPEGTTASPADVMAHLIARGAYVDMCTAAMMGNLDRVRELLDQEPSLANRVSEYVTYYLGSGSPLKNAAAKGHIEVVKLLLDRGADPNLVEEGIAPYGHALYSAVYNGHHETARLLLERGAYPSPPVESSADALSIAMMRSDEKMVDLLVSFGSARSVELLAYYGDTRTAAAVFAANPALADDPGALASAAGNGHESFVRLMLRTRPGIAKRMGAAARTRELTELLFAHGMNANHADWLGVTPLHEFARRGDVENAELFLDRGAGIHARDEDICSTPLGWAAKYGKLPMVQMLLRRGAMARHPEDPPWAAPVEWAERRGHRAIATLLKRHQVRRPLS